jgi:hypothetical protein
MSQRGVERMIRGVSRAPAERPADDHIRLIDELYRHRLLQRAPPSSERVALIRLSKEALDAPISPELADALEVCVDKIEETSAGHPIAALLRGLAGR